MLVCKGRVALTAVALVLLVCAQSQGGLIIDLSTGGYGGYVPISSTGVVTVAIKAIVTGTSTASQAQGVQNIAGSFYLSYTNGGAVDGNISLRFTDSGGSSYGFNSGAYYAGYASDTDADGWADLIGSTTNTKQTAGTTVGRPVAAFNAASMVYNNTGSSSLTAQIGDLLLNVQTVGTTAGAGNELTTVVNFRWQTAATGGVASTSATWRLDGSSKLGGGGSPNNLTLYVPYATASTPAQSGTDVNASGQQSIYGDTLYYYWTVDGNPYSNGAMTSGATVTVSTVGWTPGNHTVGFQTKASDAGVETWSTLASGVITVAGAGNDSQIYVGGSANADGSSSTLVSFGRVMAGTSHSESVTLSKTGSDSTTYHVGYSGSATSSSGDGSFGGGSGSTSIDATLVTTSTGDKTGQVTITNTASSSSGAGHGSVDGDDVITVTGTVVTNRVVTASPVSFASNLLAGAHVSNSTTLSTTGESSDYTSVGVATGGSDGLGFQVSGGTWGVFSSSSSGGSATVSGTTVMGQTGGTISLANYGESLPGESPIPVDVSYTFGTAAGKAATNGTSFGTALTASVGSGQSYADLASMTTAGTENGAVVLGTTATIREGTASAAKTVAMAWRARTAYEASTGHGHGQTLVTDVVQVSIGDGSYVDHQQTDMYVLQLSYDPALLTEGSEAWMASHGWLRLMFLDTAFAGDPQYAAEGGKWRDAALGNFGGGAATDRGVYDPGTDFVLGYYGVNTSNHTVWAVVNYSGLFALPEPATMGLLLLGGTLLIARRRRRRE